jgi:hypothetical protein
VSGKCKPTKIFFASSGRLLSEPKVRPEFQSLYKGAIDCTEHQRTRVSAKTCLELLNLAFELLDDFVCSQRHNLQSVEHAWRAKLQLHSFLKPLDGAVLGISAQSHKLFHVSDFRRHICHQPSWILCEFLSLLVHAPSKNRQHEEQLKSKIA